MLLISKNNSEFEKEEQNLLLKTKIHLFIFTLE